MANIGLNHRDYESFLESVVSMSVDVNEAADWLASHCVPEDIFPESDLQQWAEDNGYERREV